MERISNGMHLPQELGGDVLVGDASYQESRAKIERAQMLIDSWKEANERGRMNYDIVKRDLAKKVQEGEEAKRTLARLDEFANQRPLAIMAPVQSQVPPSAGRIEEVPSWTHHNNVPASSSSYVPNQMAHSASGSNSNIHFKYYKPVPSGQLPYDQLAHQQYQRQSQQHAQYAAIPQTMPSWQSSVPGPATSGTYQSGSDTSRNTYKHPPLSAAMEQDMAAKEMQAQLERQRIAREAIASEYRPNPVTAQLAPASSNLNTNGYVRYSGSGQQGQRQEPASQIVAASYRHERNKIVDPIPPIVASNTYPTAVNNIQPPQMIEIPPHPIPLPPPVQQLSTQVQIMSSVQDQLVATKPHANPIPDSTMPTPSTSAPAASSSGSGNAPPVPTPIPTNTEGLPVILNTQDEIRHFEGRIIRWAQSAPVNSYYDIPHTVCRIYKDKSAAVFLLYQDDQGNWNPGTPLSKIRTWKAPLQIPPPFVVQPPQSVQPAKEQPPGPGQVLVIREAKHADKKHLARDILRALGHANMTLKRPGEETEMEPKAKRRALGDNDPNILPGSDTLRQVLPSVALEPPAKSTEGHITPQIDPHPSVSTASDPAQPIQSTQGDTVVEIHQNPPAEDTLIPVPQNSSNQPILPAHTPATGLLLTAVPTTLLNGPQPSGGHTSLMTDSSAQSGPPEPSNRSSRFLDSVAISPLPLPSKSSPPLLHTVVNTMDSSSAHAGPSKIPSQKLAITPPSSATPQSASSAQSPPPLSPPAHSNSSSRHDGNNEPHDLPLTHISPEVTPPVSSSPSLRGTSVGPPKIPLFLPGSSASSPSRNLDTDEDEASPPIWVGRGSRVASSSTSSHRSRPDVYVLVPPLPEYVKEHKARLSRERRRNVAASRAPLAVEQIFRGGLVCNDSAEEEAVRVVCTRLRERLCKWRGCDVVMNSLGNLEHHLLQHGEASVVKSNYVQCLWQQCGRNIPYPQLSDHLRVHALSPLPCAYQDCDQSFRTPRQLLKHNQSTHGNDALKPSWLPSSYKPKSSPPMAPESLPSWMVEARQVFQPIISRERHAVLGPRVLRGISGPVGLGTRRYNAAIPPPASHQSRESEEPQQPVYDDYEFLTNSTTAHSSVPSKPSRNRRYEYLDSRTVSQYVNDGLVLWQNPEEDPGSTRGTPALADEDELNLTAAPEIKAEAGGLESLHAPAENRGKQASPPCHKSLDGLERPVLNELNQEVTQQLSDAPPTIGGLTNNADNDEGAVEAMLMTP